MGLLQVDIYAIYIHYMYAICHVTSQDDISEEPFRFMGGSFLLYISTLTSLVTIGSVIVDILFLICHVTAYLEGYVNLWVKVPHNKSPIW